MFFTPCACCLLRNAANYCATYSFTNIHEEPWTSMNIHEHSWTFIHERSWEWKKLFSPTIHKPFMTLWKIDGFVTTPNRACVVINIPEHSWTFLNSHEISWTFMNFHGRLFLGSRSTTSRIINMSGKNIMDGLKCFKKTVFCVSRVRNSVCVGTTNSDIFCSSPGATFPPGISIPPGGCDFKRYPWDTPAGGKHYLFSSSYCAPVLAHTCLCNSTVRISLKSVSPNDVGTWHYKLFRVDCGGLYGELHTYHALLVGHPTLLIPLFRTYKNTYLQQLNGLGRH